MNPYQVIVVIAASMLVFALMVAALTMMGMPLLAAFLAVYITTLWIMAGMQKRARQYCSDREQRRAMLFGGGDASNEVIQPFLPERFNIYQDMGSCAADVSRRVAKSKQSKRLQNGKQHSAFRGQHRQQFAPAIKNI